jgi:hypothetical protein
MLHTYRLGLPVVELIEPIYIWVGLPLAVVLYFIGQLLAAFRATRRNFDKIMKRPLPTTIV